MRKEIRKTQLINRNNIEKYNSVAYDFATIAFHHFFYEIYNLYLLFEWECEMFMFKSVFMHARIHVKRQVFYYMYFDCDLVEIINFIIVYSC